MSSTDAEFAQTRSALHRVAAHVLGRRRFEACGRFGLRAGPAGFATPAFEERDATAAARPAAGGDWPETIRVSGGWLVHEVGPTAATTGLQGATLRDLARFVGTDVDLPFDCGQDGPPVGDPDQPLQLDPAHARVIADWCALGSVVLDEVFASLPNEAAPATIQLWPEHFDVGTHVGLPDGRRVNLGFSPGDSYEAAPYVYIGPRDSQRPGDPAFWNAPFGALRRAPDLLASGDPRGEALLFLRAGIANASTSEGS